MKNIIIILSIMLSISLLSCNGAVKHPKFHSGQKVQLVSGSFPMVIENQFSSKYYSCLYADLLGKIHIEILNEDVLILVGEK